MSLWKEFQLLQILKDVSIKNLIKLILYENDVKLLIFKRSTVKANLWYVWSVRFWLSIPEINTSRKAMKWLICFSIVNLMWNASYLKNLKNLMNFLPCEKQLECHQHILNKI